MQFENQQEPTSQNNTSQPAQPFSEHSKLYQSRPAKTYVPFNKNYAQEVCVMMGVALSAIGLVGFVVDNFLSTDITNTQNAIHLVAGAMSLWFGFNKVQNARRFSLSIGAFYAALGLLGFIFGTAGLPTMGPVQQEHFLWKPAPTLLELGTTDHTLHLVFAGVLILGATLKFKRYQQI